MSKSVCQTNSVNQPCPQNLEELVNFVNYIKSNPNSIFLQISGLGESVVRELAELLGTNFFQTNETDGLNPFTVIYIDHDGNIQSHMLNEKSKLIVYGTRTVYHH